MFLFSIQLVTSSAVIKGKVYDAETKQPLCCANVVIHELMIGDGCGNDGEYTIKNMLMGQYTVKVTLIGYITLIDSIKVEGSDDVLEMNFELYPCLNEDSVSINKREAYNQKMQELNEKEPVLEVVIDSLEYNEGTLQVYSSITNKADDSVYVLRTFNLFDVMSATITDEEGNKVKGTRTFLDYIGEKVCADVSDLILIRPHAKINYPAFDLWEYGFDRMLKGTYTIKIEYEYVQGKPFIPCTLDESNIKALALALRGKYISANSITFENK